MMREVEHNIQDGVFKLGEIFGELVVVTEWVHPLPLVPDENQSFLKQTLSNKKKL